MPALKSQVIMPVPAPTEPSRHRPLDGLLDGAVDVLGADVPPDGVVQARVVALADERDDHVVLVADAGMLLGHPLDRRVGDLADRHRVGEQDRRLEQAPLGDLGQPRDLAGAVEHEAAGRCSALVEDVGVRARSR